MVAEPARWLSPKLLTHHKRQRMHRVWGAMATGWPPREMRGRDASLHSGNHPSRQPDPPQHAQPGSNTESVCWCLPLDDTVRKYQQCVVGRTACCARAVRLTTSHLHRSPCSSCGCEQRVRVLRVSALLDTASRIRRLVTQASPWELRGSPTVTLRTLTGADTTMRQNADTDRHRVNTTRQM